MYVVGKSWINSANGLLFSVVSFRYFFEEFSCPVAHLVGKALLCQKALVDVVSRIAIRHGIEKVQKRAGGGWSQSLQSFELLLRSPSALQCIACKVSIDKTLILFNRTEKVINGFHSGQIPF